MRTRSADGPDVGHGDVGTPRPGLAATWARLCYRLRWPILVAWAVIAVCGGSRFDHLEDHLRLPDYSISGSDSQRTADLITERFPRLGTEQVAIVVTGDDTDALARAVGSITSALHGIEGVGDIVDPTTPQVGPELLADDSRTALVLAPLNGSVSERDTRTDRIESALHEVALPAGVAADLTGETPLNKALADVERQDQLRAEIIGLTLAVLLLLWGLRSLLAAVLAVGSAAMGVTLSSIGIAGVSGVAETSQFALVVATIIGLAVGVDYALFMISRFREGLPGRGAPPARPEQVIAALRTCMRTSGHTVIVSGVIVMVSLCSITVIDGPVFRDIAIAAALVVLCSLLAAMTGLPALLSVSATRLRPRATRHTDSPEGTWYRWVAFVQRRPASLGIPAAALLVALAIPAAGMRLGLDLGIPTLSHTSAGSGYSSAAAAFGGSAVAPIHVSACTDDAQPLSDNQTAAVREYFDDVRKAEGVLSVASAFDATFGRPGQPDPRRLAGTPLGSELDDVLVDDIGAPSCLLGVVQSDQAVDSPATTRLVGHLRDAGARLAPLGVTTGVAGMAAQYRDIATETSRMFPVVIALVLALSLVYLIVMLRSIVIPIKAIVLNALATAAALGATVAVFQYGYGESLLDFHSVGTIQAFLPVAMFAVLFGLSMDYEVFMVQRVREEYLRCGDNREAVRRAMGAVAPQITIAGLIMIAVFGALTVADVLELQQIGFGLAIAIAIDITVLRLIVVPVLMSVADKWNWWLPFQGATSHEQSPKDHPLPKVTDKVPG
ncbi:MMPL family transporter [Nocardia callitridis]|uniref:MMPL family transporter n=1 Tax=Nocardia callitridis TaxID=648753 RepID=A0ABP9KBN0_9NOCA